ncbi:unnamed protein product [Rotaria sordida]|uniref:Uncharacterized protein n=1 Tax=Rotaria sordida TaxID=392033 RepID=A0A813VN01_9BILA|nr:unnamed protein product [Rotaria sordida]CAF1373278.1 unnamed protein product [Rotaria sordida]
MIEWINLNIQNESIFAGTMANLKLSTGRRIIVHSHYEHRKIRHLNYYVYESHWCTIINHPKGCSFPEMYGY